MIGIRDTSSRRPEPPPVLAAGGSYVDPIFGTKHTRLTDGNDSPPVLDAAGLRTPWVHTQGYAQPSAFNKTSEYFILSLNGIPTLYALRGGAPVNLRPLFQGSIAYDAKNIEVDSIRWSPVNPTVCYAVEPAKQRIVRINVAIQGDASFSEYKRFSTMISTASKIYQPSCSDDENRWAFHAVYPDGSTTAYIWDRPSNTILRTYQTHPGDPTILECVITPCGTGARVMYHDESVTFWREGALDTTIGPDDLEHAIVEHVDWDWFAMAGARKSDNALMLRRLFAPTGAAKVLFQPGWKHGYHVAVHPDFILVSTYLGDRTWGAYELELIKVYRDGRIVRFGHTHSYGVGGSIDVAGGYVVAGTNWRPYYQQPRACVSPDGRFAIYARGAADGSVDAYLVEIPADDASLIRDDYETYLKTALDHAVADEASTQSERDQAIIDRDAARAERDALAAKNAAAKAALE